MQINAEILATSGAVSKIFKKSDPIFHEGVDARFYFQILNGIIRMFSTNFDGKEFTKSEFKAGYSFGEPHLFIDENHVSIATAFEENSILRLSSEKILWSSQFF